MMPTVPSAARFQTTAKATVASLTLGLVAHTDTAVAKVLWSVENVKRLDYQMLLLIIVVVSCQVPIIEQSVQ